MATKMKRSIGSIRFDLPDHVNAPHCNRPRSGQDIQWKWGYMYFVSVDLALVTSSRMLMAVSFHSGPIVTRSQNLLAHSVSTRMSSKDTVMHVFHNLFCFLLVHTTK